MHTFKLYLWSPSFGREVAKVAVKPTPRTGEPIAQKKMGYKSRIHIIPKTICVCSSALKLQMPPHYPVFGTRATRKLKLSTPRKASQPTNHIYGMMYSVQSLEEMQLQDIDLKHYPNLNSELKYDSILITVYMYV